MIAEAAARPDSDSARLPRFLDLLRRPAVGWSLLVVAVWRLVVAIDGIVSYHLLTHCVCQPGVLLRGNHWSANPLSVAIDAMYRGDAAFYVSLARDGYHYNTHHTSTMGFFPMFSIVIKGVSIVTGNMFVAGAIASTLCLFAAVALFAVWLEERGYGKRAPVVVALMLCFPFSVTYGAIYSESLFLLLALAAFLSFERRRWYTCAVLTALIALTRPTGAVVMVPALVVMAYYSSPRDWRSLLPIPAACVSLGLFCAYQWKAFGTPLAYVRAKQVPGWEVGPHRLLADFLLQGKPGRSTEMLALMMAVGLLFLASVPFVWRRFGPGYGVYCLLCVLGSLSAGLPGLDRYVIVAFPSFATLGVAGKPRVLFALCLAGFYGLLVTVSLFEQGLQVT